MAFALDQYLVSEPFFGVPADANMVASTDDAKRIQAYALYEDLYKNNHRSLKIVLRGADSLPMYIPTGKKIVNTTARFLGKGFDYYIEPEGVDGQSVPENTVQELDLYMKNLFKREGLKLKFSSNKKWGLVRADAVFMIVADPEKEAGQRISIHEIDPSCLVAIDDPDDPTRVMGFHMVERVRDFREKEDDTKKQICRRSTWIKERNDDGKYTGQVMHSVTHWTIGKWDDRYLAEDRLEQIVNAAEDLEPEALKAPISQLPFYVWNNDAPQNSTWGTSLLSGFETLIFGLNQSLSDEDLTLVMRGLGMYVTNSGPPVNPLTGAIMSWPVGPGQVVELGGTDQTFTNVAGVGSVDPYIDHMTFMDEKGISEAGGLPMAAIGKADVAIAESGISLKLQMDPLIAANADRELEMIIVLDQMLHDIVQMWLPAYEEMNVGNATVTTIFDDPMPENKDQVIQDTVLLRTSNLILTSMAVDKLSAIGWKYPADMTVDDIVAALTEQAAGDAAALDPFASSGGSGEEPLEEDDPLIEADPITNGQTVSLGIS